MLLPILLAAAAPAALPADNRRLSALFDADQADRRPA